MYIYVALNIYIYSSTVYGNKNIVIKYCTMKNRLNI